jgi:hypothetical protein
MQRRGLASAALYVCVLMFFTGTAFSDPVWVGMQITVLKDSDLKAQGKTLQNEVGNTALEQLFTSFCLERNVHTDLSTPGSVVLYEIVGLSDRAKSGGVGGQVPDSEGGGDPISDETAWIYYMFRIGTLDSFLDSSPGARELGNAVQRAIWVLEDENPLSEKWSDPEADLISRLITESQNAVSNGWGNNGRVGVLNIEQKISEGEYVEAQDMLYLISVPEPATLSLLGLSLAGLGLASRRKR